MKDLFGKALLDYQNGNYTEDIITSTSISDQDALPLPYLFRDFKEMPEIEQKALQLAKGNVLDVGCGAGSHSLYLQNKGFDVTSIDISKGAIEVCKQRGIKKVHVKNILEETETFDTILLLMNGTGVFQILKNTVDYLKHLKSLLKPNGQILIDSSDIKYMYLDEDGGYWQNIESNYYGELEYSLSYKDEEEIPLKWLYLDIKTFRAACFAADLEFDLVIEGAHYDYLARLY